MERNQYKERLMELQEAVRWTGKELSHNNSYPELISSQQDMYEISDFQLKAGQERTSGRGFQFKENEFNSEFIDREGFRAGSKKGSFVLAK